MTEKEHDWEKLFHSHDTDGSGELDIKEFVQCIRKSAKLSSDSIQEDELTHMFQYLDKDKGIDGSSDWECGLGQVSIEEFMAFINGGVVGVLVGAPQGESTTLGSCEVLWSSCFRGYQSGQRTVFSGTCIITVLQCVYMWLVLQLCGCSRPTGTHGNAVLTANPRAQARRLQKKAKERTSLSSSRRTRGERSRSCPAAWAA